MTEDLFFLWNAARCEYIDLNGRVCLWQPVCDSETVNGEQYVQAAKQPNSYSCGAVGLAILLYFPWREGWDVVKSMQMFPLCTSSSGCHEVSCHRYWDQACSQHLEKVLTHSYVIVMILSFNEHVNILTHTFYFAFELLQYITFQSLGS